jgi:Fur family transcriptional regulator, ferric uptake regulator
MDTQTLITDAGLRPTKARIAVLNAIANATSALSHTEILELLSTQKEFDRVTIYRVLDWLTAHGIVHKISGDNRAWKFQISQHHYAQSERKQNSIVTNHHHHAHLHCQKCGKITCIHELEPNFPKKALAQYQVTAIDINIKGICADCSSQAALNQ